MEPKNKTNHPLKIATILVVAILLTSSAYVIFFTSELNLTDLLLGMVYEIWMPLIECSIEQCETI